MRVKDDYRPVVNSILPKKSAEVAVPFVDRRKKEISYSLKHNPTLYGIQDDVDAYVKKDFGHLDTRSNPFEKLLAITLGLPTTTKEDYIAATSLKDPKKREEIAAKARMLLNELA